MIGEELAIREEFKDTGGGGRRARTFVDVNAGVGGRVG